MVQNNAGSAITEMTNKWHSAENRINFLELISVGIMPFDGHQLCIDKKAEIRIKKTLMLEFVSKE